MKKLSIVFAMLGMVLGKEVAANAQGLQATQCPLNYECFAVGTWSFAAQWGCGSGAADFAYGLFYV